MRHQDIVFNVSGQSFFFDVPEGRPSAGDVSVFDALVDDDADTEDATTGAVAIDSVDTTLSASSSAGATSVSVDSAAAIARGRTYLVTSAGIREFLEVLGVTGTTVKLRRPLVNDLASGATFEGCRLSIGVNATWMADRGNLTDEPSELGAGAAGYRLRWTYTVAGENLVGVSFADLVRYPAKNLVTPPMVDDRFPGWIDRLPIDHRRDQGATFIIEAFDAVKADALGDDQAMRRIRDTQVICELVKYRANVIAIENNVLAGSQSTTELETAERLYRTRYAQLLRSPKVPIDQTGGGAHGKADRLPLTRR